MKSGIIYILLLSTIFTIVSGTIALPKKDAVYSCNDDSWEKQIIEMNHLIIRISSVNIIQGLFFTKEQAEELKKIADVFEIQDIPSLDTTGNSSIELIKVRRAYITLLDHLIKRKPISDSLIKWVNSSRIIESDIIKKSLLGAQKTGYSGEGCQQCHAPPAKFPTGDISSKETDFITAEERVIIDKAHSIGLFGEAGMLSLWNLKGNIDKILFDGQKHIMKNFKCCLIPPSDLSDPTNIGQAFVSSDWINYFKIIRKFPDTQWQKYKSLFILPLDTLLKATLPGIKASDRKERLKNATVVIEKSRTLDDIDFELQKETLCLELMKNLSVTSLTGEANRQSDIRQFITAMFILFPGSADIYTGIIEDFDKEKK